MKFKKRKPDNRLLELFLIHCVWGITEEPHIKAMRGNPESRILMIAPPCDESEYDQGVPFCNEPAKSFHYWAQEQCGIDTERDFLICSANVYGQPKKHSTNLVVNFIQGAIAEELFDKLVCVGSSAFRYIFAEGKTSKMETLIGQTLYMGIFSHTPVFVLPDITMLAPPFTNDKKLNWVLGRQQQECMRRLEKLTQPFKHFVQQ